jgi:hypothetical protein
MAGMVISFRVARGKSQRGGLLSLICGQAPLGIFNVTRSARAANGVAAGGMVAKQVTPGGGIWASIKPQLPERRRRL